VPRCRPELHVFAQLGRKLAHVAEHPVHPDAVAFAIERAEENGNGLAALNALHQAYGIPPYVPGSLWEPC